MKKTIKLNLDYENVNVSIRMTATRTMTYTNVNDGKPVVRGYYEITFSAPVKGAETEGYEIRPSQFNAKDIVLYHNGVEVKTYTNGMKPIANGKVELNFLTKDQAKAAAETMRQNKDVFIKMYNRKKINTETIRELVGSLPVQYKVENDAMGRQDIYKKALNGDYYKALKYDAAKKYNFGIHSCRFNTDFAEWLKKNINNVGIFDVMLKANEIYAESWGHYPKDDKEWIDDLCYELLVTVEDKAWLEFPESEESHNMLAYMSIGELRAHRIF